MKVLGTANPADLMTKYLTREKVDNAIDKMGQVVQSGRASSSLDIQGKINQVKRMVETESKSDATEGGARAPSVGPDCWRRNGDKAVRFHSQPRSELFAVTAKDPNYESLGPIRTTRGRDQAGNEFILHDYWRAAKRPRRRQPFQWTGTTTFHGGEDPCPSPPRWSARAPLGWDLGLVNPRHRVRLFSLR